MSIDSIFGYKFKDPKILAQALTHPSVNFKDDDGHEKKIPDYERLEFLGDSVLGFLVTDFLVNNYTEEDEGLLARRRSALVCGEVLSAIAKQINLGPLINMTSGEVLSGGRENPKTLENSLEAVIGALYLDGGIELVRDIVSRYWEPLALEMHDVPVDPKTSLQEWAQKNGRPIPEYRTISVTGPSHAPTFKIEVIVEGVNHITLGSGSSKRVAEREAAQEMLKIIHKK